MDFALQLPISPHAKNSLCRGKKPHISQLLLRRPSSVDHFLKPNSSSSRCCFSGVPRSLSSNSCSIIRSSQIITSSGSRSSSLQSENESAVSHVKGGQSISWGEERGSDKKKPLVTVVLMGWLGSEPKNLKKLADLYNSMGFRSATFATSLKNGLSFDLGRKWMDNVNALASELVSWLSQSEKDGRDRFLAFHTFSNTGWLAYGAILDNLQGRPDLLDKIKGCVIDSGGDPSLNPKVWAAGFTAALLKKRNRSSPLSSSRAARNPSGNGLTVLSSQIQEKGHLLTETLLLSSLEKLFSFILNNMTTTKKRFTNIVYVLSERQPDIPQLYMYSTADRVIPYNAIESFAEDQMLLGRRVWSFNFHSSPHLYHYWNFPGLYESQLQKFLQECQLITVENCEKKTTPAD